jgi:hypothetical protein
MNEISIAIKISKFKFSADELTTKLNLTPSHYHYKGESFFSKTSNGEIEKFYKSNYWEHRTEIKSSEWVQLLINKFINEIIIDRKSILKSINKEASLEFFIGVNYYNEANPSFHFESEHLVLLADIGFELDLDLYNFSGNE